MHSLRAFGLFDLRFLQKKVELVTETLGARGGFHCFLLRNSEDRVDLFKNGLGLVLTILILSYFPKEEVKRRDFGVGLCFCAAFTNPSIIILVLPSCDRISCDTPVPASMEGMEKVQGCGLVVAEFRYLPVNVYRVLFATAVSGSRWS